MNNKYKVLLVEDDNSIRTLVATLLENAGYQVIRAESCKAAKTMFSSYIPDLVLLDLGLPDNDGTVLLEHIRQSSLVPVIVLSARTDERDKVNALDMGANDYVTKPFGSAELLARVRSALRFNRRTLVESQSSLERFTLHDLTIDYDARRVFVGDEGIKFTQTEYNIIALLSENIGRMMTYSAIINAVWGDTAHATNIKKLQVNMANIRKKFGSRPGETKYIKNELGVGYRMDE